MNRSTNEWVILVSWVVLVACILAWPVSAFTWAQHEPRTILSLGFLGLIIPQASLLLSAYIRKDVETS